MNFFKKEGALSQMPSAELMSIKASRVYAALLTLSVLTVIIFNALDQVTVSETISFPSLARYDQLQAKYPETFACTCQNIGVFYKNFATFRPTIHQVSYFFTLY